ncbi:MAG: hypothetical protein WBF17_03205 [Phycisphaerae bacterium]
MIVSPFEALPTAWTSPRQTHSYGHYRAVGRRANYPLYTRDRTGPLRPLAFDAQTRTITSGGPMAATEAACLLLKALVRKKEYRTFRRSNPWLFGIRDEFAPRLQCVR